MSAPLGVRVAVIGIDHPHVFGMVHAVVSAGAELSAWHQPGSHGLSRAFASAYPEARAAAEMREILEDESIQLVLCAGVNAERAQTAIAAMRHGKDVLSDKPGVTDLSDLSALRHVQAETGRIYSVYFSERLENRATEHASELVASGAIGRVLHTVGLGPHRLDAASRPAWFFDPVRSGGILCDIASHQIEQFLHFTGTETASIAAARVANHAHPAYPGWNDFGELLLEGAGCSGYVRVDWFTPDGLATWGDCRLTVLGTEGFIEIRKNIDLAAHSTGNHLFLVDGTRTRHIDCRDVELPFARRLLDDVTNRTETALSQAHCFQVCELALDAEAKARAVPAG